MVRKKKILTMLHIFSIYPVKQCKAHRWDEMLSRLPHCLLAGFQYKSRIDVNANLVYY